MSIDQQLDASHSRRMAREDRARARIDARELAAEQFIGTLIRDGKEIYYICPVWGRYREGSRSELIAFMLRNWYV